MSNPDQEIETLNRFKSTGVLVINVFTVDQIKIWESLKAAREALEFALVSIDSIEAECKVRNAIAQIDKLEE